VCALCAGLLIDHFPVRVKCLELTGPQWLYLYLSLDIAAVLLLFLFCTSGLFFSYSLTVKGRGSCRLPETVGRAVGLRAMDRVRVKQTGDHFGPVVKDPRTGEESNPYLHTTVVYRDGAERKLFIIRFAPDDKKPMEDVTADIVNKLKIHADDNVAKGSVGGPPLELDPAKAFFACPSTYLKYPKRWSIELQFEEGIWLKDTRLITYGDKDGWESWQNLLKSELTILETLRHEAPHPNIAAYLGCAVMDVGDAGRGEEDLRVVSIVMEKYNSTLAERCKEKQPPLDVTKCIEGVSAALTYLHSKKLCHNDVHMSNVMLKDDDTAVLIDFDACLTEGDPLKKGSALEWRVNSKTSDPKNDWFGVSLLKEELLKAFPPPDARPPEGRPACSGGSSG